MSRLWLCLLVTTLALDAGAAPAAAQSTQELVILPTLGTDHQFDLDYSVVHLDALLHTIDPDAIVIDDVTGWLDNGCLWQPTAPEHHVALRFARARGIPILGTSTREPTGAYERALERAGEYREMDENTGTVFRERLDREAARIGRSYSYAAGPQTLSRLLDAAFPAIRSEWAPKQRQAIEEAAAELADSLVARMRARPDRDRWIAVLWWGFAGVVEDSVRSRKRVRVTPVETYLPLGEDRLSRHRDFGKLAWILSGVLDEWYGMWAPQAFDNARIVDLLRELESLAPDDPVTRFLRARWLMQQRDYAAAEPILADLVESAGDARFPFPMNGKWIRPPWSSVARKAMLNLAFIHDYRGERERALKLYGEILSAGGELNREAQAVGYVFDDIQRVIQGYTNEPYAGNPEEAFRHFPLTSGVPECTPAIR